MTDAELIQRGYDVAISCKTNQQIEVSGAYLELVSRQLKTAEGHHDFMLMIDRLVYSSQKRAR